MKLSCWCSSFSNKCISRQSIVVENIESMAAYICHMQRETQLNLQIQLSSASDNCTKAESLAMTLVIVHKQKHRTLTSGFRGISWSIFQRVRCLQSKRLTRLIDLHDYTTTSGINIDIWQFWTYQIITCNPRESNRNLMNGIEQMEKVKSNFFCIKAKTNNRTRNLQAAYMVPMVFVVALFIDFLH